MLWPSVRGLVLCVIGRVPWLEVLCWWSWFGAWWLWVVSAGGRGLSGGGWAGCAVVGSLRIAGRWP